MTTKPGDRSSFTKWMLGCAVGLCLCSCGRRFIPEEAAATPSAVQAAIPATATSLVTPTAQPIPAEAIAAQAIALATEVARPTATPDARVLNPENQHLYLFIGNPDTWHRARDTCASRGGYLVTIESVSENGFVFELAAIGSWLGATDEIEEGTWVWVTGAPWDYANWDRGEPSDWAPDRGAAEHYLSYSSQGATWNDQPLENSNPFVCEWEPVSP